MSLCDYAASVDSSSGGSSSHHLLHFLYTSSPCAVLSIFRSLSPLARYFVSRLAFIEETEGISVQNLTFQQQSEEMMNGGGGGTSSKNKRGAGQMQDSSSSKDHASVLACDELMKMGILRVNDVSKRTVSLHSGFKKHYQTLLLSG